MRASTLDVSYADLALILTAVISGCAAQRWPGRNIDTKRFVELLVMHSEPEDHCDYISIPALLSSQFIQEADTPWGVPGKEVRIFRDDEVDMPLSEARSKYPGLGVSDLKKHSYSYLLYSWLRCGYAHEYCASDNTTEFPPSRDRARLSYIGRHQKDGTIRRMTAFHLDYILSLAQYHVDHIAEHPEPLPVKWWIEIG